MSSEKDDPQFLKEASLLEPLVAERLFELRQRIAHAGGDERAVTVVAVTKTFGPAAVAAAVSAGIGDIGENYAAEVLSKSAVVKQAGFSPRWHFIGSIQRNKVASLSGVVDCWQSVSRLVEAEAICQAAASSRQAFVEVNLSGDDHRTGCDLAEAGSLVEASVAAGLTVRGLMAVAPLGGREVAEAAFLELARLNASLGLAELSIGMSGDIEAAVSAGTTMVRVGSALFGPRDPHAGR